MKGIVVIFASLLLCLVSVASYGGDNGAQLPTVAAVQPAVAQPDIAPFKSKDTPLGNYSPVRQKPVQEACGGNYAKCTSDSQCCGGRICTGGHCCCQ